MSRDPTPHRTALITTVTTVQLQTELLQRQLQRRNGLRDADRQWLEHALATLLRSTRELATLIVEATPPPPVAELHAVPTLRLLALPRTDNRN